MKRWLRKGIRLGLLASVVAGVVQLVKRKTAPPSSGGDGSWKSSPLSVPMPSSSSPNGSGALEEEPPPPPLVEPTMISELASRPRTAPGDSGLAPDGDEPTAPEPEAPEAPEPEPVAKAPAPKPKAKAKPAWIEPDGDHCPRSHPVKAKLASGIYHLVGMRDYGRTNPDRCYRDPEAAEADGLRQAKR